MDGWLDLPWIERTAPEIAKPSHKAKNLLSVFISFLSRMFDPQHWSDHGNWTAQARSVRIE